MFPKGIRRGVDFHHVYISGVADATVRSWLDEDEILVVGGVENAGLVGIDVEVHGFP